VGKSSKVEVTEYRMSIHYGLCLGPVDKIVALEAGDREFWQGELAANGYIDAYQPDLFGGNRKEGGVDGVVYFLKGEDSQVLPDNLAARLVPGATGAQVPGFRGITSVFLTGAMDKRKYGATSATPTYSGWMGLVMEARARAEGALALLPGFAWSHNNPNVPPLAARVVDIPRALNTTFAEMENGHANPAHIIYECLTDPEWGMGASPGTVDIANFNAVSEVLFNERFGLSFLWDRQGKIEDFVKKVVEHIQASVYVNPRTGLWTIKLFRNDYDPDSLPSFNDSNCVIEDFSRRLLGETINEMTVEWAHPVTGKGSAVTQQDLANVIAQGGEVIADQRKYEGIRDEALANRVCARDLRAASTPLASANVRVLRTGWDLNPGDCIRLSSVEHEFENVVFRVLNVNRGRVGSRYIKLSVVEDIFAFESANFTLEMPTLSESPNVAPENMAYSAFMTLPYYMAGALLDDSIEFPEALVGVFAGQTGSATHSYDLATVRVQDNGAFAYQNLGERSATSRSTLPIALSAEAQTIGFPMPALSHGAPPVVNGFMVIGTVEAEQEIVLLSDSDSYGSEWTLERGVLDTVPQDWPAGTPFWIVSLDDPFADTTLRAVGETAKFKLLSRTSLGTLPESLAVEREYTLIDRPDLPLRPTGISLNGVSFGEFDARDIDPESITATWRNRNRLLEEGQVLKWNDAGVTPEDGQTTEIEVYNDSGALLRTIDGLTGESHTFDTYDFLGANTATLRFVSRRDGKVSLQGHEIRVRVTSKGYGLAYGYSYGG